MFRLKYLFVLSGLLFASCALPPSNRPQQDFVDQRELKVISLLAEAGSASLIGKFITAELTLRQALFISAPKESHAIKIQLAQVLGKQQLYEEADDLFEELLKETPHSKDVLVPQALYLSEKGDMEGARSAFEKLMNLAETGYEPNQVALKNSAFSQSYRNLSVMAFKYGYLEDALCYSYDANFYGPNALEMARHARLLNSLGFPERNIEYLKPLLKAATPLAEVLAELALSYVGVEKFQEALGMCRIVQSRKRIPAELTTPCLWIDIYQYFLDLPEKKRKKASVDDDEEELTPEELEEQRKEKILALQEIDLGTSLSRVYWPERFVQLVEEVIAEREKLEEE